MSNSVLPASTLTPQTFDRLVESILVRKPVLRDIVIEFGSSPVIEYARDRKSVV